jgi:uncharacterized membrane protein YfhO
MSDGTPLCFTFDHESARSEVWFYSFDEAAYAQSMQIMLDNSLSNVSYTNDGICMDMALDNDTDVLLLLPYDDGYTISVDDINCDYSSYRDAFIKINCTSGTHRILIRYCTPGLKRGFAISFAGMFFLICMIAYELKLRRLIHEQGF